MIHAAKEFGGLTSDLSLLDTRMLLMVQAHTSPVFVSQGLPRCRRWLGLDGWHGRRRRRRYR